LGKRNWLSLDFVPTGTKGGDWASALPAHAARRTGSTRRANGFVMSDAFHGSLIVLETMPGVKDIHKCVAASELARYASFPSCHSVL
jgi:hypothetical protein